MRVGYTGGTRAYPTYHRLGDHTEAFQIDYDPAVVSYDELLAKVWAGHNPTRPLWKRQYMNAIYVHDEGQQAAAEASRAAVAKHLGATVHTQIISVIPTGSANGSPNPAETFYMAEDYHQKFYLRQKKRLVAAYVALYPDLLDFTNSTATARLNGYVSGAGSPQQLEQEIDLLGLSAELQSELHDLVARSYKRRAIC